MIESVEARRFDRGDGLELAYRPRAGASPTLIFLPGYASDMDGGKAIALDRFAADRGLAMLRFDYSGTGLSDGNFDDGTIEIWLADALATIDARQCRVVELRFFAGLTIDEAATALGISPATVEREWAFAKAWLYRQLSSQA